MVALGAGKRIQRTFRLMGPDPKGSECKPGLHSLHAQWVLNGCTEQNEGFECVPDSLHDAVWLKSAEIRVEAPALPVDAIGEEGELNLLIETSPDREVVVRIADTGCGIPAENFDTIFASFFTTKGEKGTGIGLWVTKSILEKVGGRIEVVSSTTGKRGTCFSVFLPATSAGTQTIETKEERKHRPA